jgi:hypothetical protein
MHKILANQKGFNVNFNPKGADRKQLSPLQKKCLDVVMDTQKVMEEAVKHEQVKQMESTLYQIVALQTLLPSAMKSNNEEVIKMQLRSLYELVNKVEVEKVPRVFLKEFLAYRKRIIERIGRL